MRRLRSSSSEDDVLNYFLTVESGNRTIVRRMPFDDYADALHFLAKYYRPRLGRGTLPFTTEVVDGKFMRSYTELLDPETMQPKDEPRYVRAVKLSTAFQYDAPLFFLVESEAGMQDTDVDD